MTLQYRIGDRFITHEDSRVSLVRVAGTKKRPVIERIEFLSEPVDNINTLIDLVKVTARERKIPWNTSFFDGKVLAPYRIKTPLEPAHGSAVLGGFSVPTGGLVLGGLAGAKRRLETDPVGAIAQLLNYGEEGRDIALAYLQESVGDDLLFETYWSLAEQIFATPEQVIHYLGRIYQGDAKLRMRVGWLVQLSTCKIVCTALGE